MKRNHLAGLLWFSALVACDDTKGGTAAAPSASAATATPSAAAPAPSPSESAAPADPTPAASASAAPSEPAREAVVTVRDPAAEPSKTVQALVGGTVTLYLPEYPGTKWTISSADKRLGKPKEETIPGFAGPSTPAHQFTWSTAAPALKAGQSHVVALANTKKGEAKADKTFTLTIALR